jgi:hypothetical protein
MSLENINGARRVYGPRGVENKAASGVVTYGVISEQRVTVNGATGNVPFNADDEVYAKIPAGSHVITARCYTEEEFSNTFAAALVDSDGVTIEALFTAHGGDIGWDDAEITPFNLNTQAQVAITATPGAEGSAVLVIEYLPPLGEFTPPPAPTPSPTSTA